MKASLRYTSTLKSISILFFCFIGLNLHSHAQDVYYTVEKGLNKKPLVLFYVSNIDYNQHLIYNTNKSNEFNLGGIRFDHIQMGYLWANFKRTVNKESVHFYFELLTPTMIKDSKDKKMRVGSIQITQNGKTKEYDLKFREDEGF